MTPRSIVCAAALLLVSPVLADSPAAILAEQGHWKQLRSIVDARVKANPNDAEAQWLLSRVRMAYRDPDGALAPAEKSVSLDPKNAAYRWQVAQVVGEQAGRASVFRQMSLARRFRQEAEAAIAMDPKYTEAMSGLMLYYERAPGIVGGDSKKADEMVDRISAINRADGIRARISLLQERKPAPTNAQLEALFVQLVQADPSRYDSHTGLAQVYGGANPAKWDLVEKEALAARTVDPDRVLAYQILAGVYATRARWADLDAHLADCEKRFPENYAPYLRAAGALLQSGTDLPRAERYTRKYLTIEPEPNFASLGVAHWRLGLILEKEGRKAEAINEVKTATELDPKFEQAQRDLKRLRS